MGGLLLELPTAPPFDTGASLRIWWRDVIVRGEVRNVTCRPGFVGIGVQIREVVTGSVLESVQIEPDSNAASAMPALPFSPAWDLEQVERGKIVQNALTRAFAIIMEFVPSGRDQAAALQHVSEAATDCRRAIDNFGSCDSKS